VTTSTSRYAEELARHGLVRGENGLELYVMCEIPSNVIRAADFAQIFDGFSIGSNDLTQLTLGVDRDSEELAALFDERDPAVRDLIALAIERAHAAGRKIGICGQAPSDHPENRGVPRRPRDRQHVAEPRRGLEDHAARARAGETRSLRRDAARCGTAPRHDRDGSRGRRI
jgi:phosphoenolpyruvate synthase/pyruvate phosphate dikinase